MGKLYVANLPFASTDSDLKAHFEKIGTVTSAKVITDRQTGRSRGFGFVEMEHSDQAITDLNDSEMGEESNPRKISVSIAREREEGKPHGERRSYRR